MAVIDRSKEAAVGETAVVDPSKPKAAKPPRQRAKATTQVQAITWLLTALAALGLWTLAYAFVFSGLQEHRSQAVLYTTFREQLALETAPAAAPIEAGKPVALIDAPAVGITRMVVVQGTTGNQLRSGPGHRADTVLPGQVGVSVLYGRSLTFGAPFGDIHRLRAGNIVSVTTSQGKFGFRVDDVRRTGDPLPAPLAAGGSRIVLVTSTGAALSPGHVLYVDATLVRATAATVGATQPIGKADAAMASDTSHLPQLVLWLQGLAVVSIALAWSLARWGRWTTWLAGAPVLLLFIWGATSTAAMLAPNLV